MTTPASDPIVCKPTPWFLLRALAMLLMFGIFAVLFFVDGSTGYRKKNEGYYYHKTFQRANADFAAMDNDGSLTPERWRAYAEQQTVDFPEDRSVLPAHVDPPVPWPEILHDYDQMKPLQWNLLWKKFSGERRFNESPPEEPYTARKIAEQWWFAWVCLGLAVAAAFVLLRTLRRSIVADGEAVRAQNGRRVPYPEMRTLDLRKWETKGLAFIDYENESGRGRLRIDGLTYGGFKKEHDEPAEQLMQRIRANFSGEIIEYAAVPEPETGGTAADET